MTKVLSISSEIRYLIKKALKEDIGTGDITTAATIPEAQKATANIIAKSEGILAGLTVCVSTFLQVDKYLKCTEFFAEGTALRAGDKVLEITGSAASILKAERTALNFLGRMSGIATLTGEAVTAVKGTEARILDTRKTIPGLRLLDKYAVKIGGGENHRFGLYDQFLIKENHVEAAGGLKKAIKQCLAFRKKQDIDALIIAEARTLNEAEEAARAGADRVLLDNMKPVEIRKIVEILGESIDLEVSGGIDLKNIREYAETGVGFISLGMLTHSVKVMDYSLLIE